MVIKKLYKKMTLLKLRQAQGGQAFPAMNDIFNLFDNSIHSGFRSWSTPAVNIANNKNGYEIQVAAPGLKKDDFKVNIEGDQLSISVDSKKENNDKEEVKFSHQ